MNQLSSYVIDKNIGSLGSSWAALAASFSRATNMHEVFIKIPTLWADVVLFRVDIVDEVLYIVCLK